MISENLIKRILSSIILLPLTFFAILTDSIFFNLFIIICLFISILEWNKMINKVFFKYFGFIFLIFSFYSVFKLKYDLEYKNFYLLLGISICIATDLGGYIFGKIFKGPKLTSISPNKTYSGFIGAIILSLITSLFFYKYDYLLNISLQSKINYFIVVVLISIVSQLGDLTISFFKRMMKINDTGNIIPGHGGLLDRIDGMIFSIPFLYLIVEINIFNFL